MNGAFSSAMAYGSKHYMISDCNIQLLTCNFYKMTRSFQQLKVHFHTFPSAILH